MDDTKARVLAAAFQAFSTVGYHRTSLQAIARRAKISKPAVLYHFATKADLLGELSRPLIEGLVAALDRAGEIGSADSWTVAHAVLEGLTDVFMAQRHLLRMNLADLALVEAGVFGKFVEAMLRANRMVAGPNPTFEDKVRAAQAISAIGDPIALYADAPGDALRVAVLDGVYRIAELQRPTTPFPSIAMKGTSPAVVARGSGRPRGESKRHQPMRRRTGRGRPKLLDARDTERARKAHARGESADAIAERLGLSRATVYRYLRQ